MKSRPRMFWPLAIALTAVSIATAQDTQPQSAPKLTDEQMEQFLKTAKIVKIKELSTGITHSRRATLSDGTITHDAHVQSIDEHKARHLGVQHRGIQARPNSRPRYDSDVGGTQD